MKLSKIFLAVLLSASVFFLGCGPKDAEVQASITDTFAATPELTNVTATVTDGVATLSGEVMNEASSALAATKAKDIKGVKSVVNNTTIAAPPPMPPVDGLSQGVMDAVKDFPTVSATVANGEITLTGTIERDKLPTLMQALNSLSPSKINNQLTIK